MSNPPKYTTTEQGLEVVILDSGKPYVTQRSYARFAGVSRDTVQRRLKMQPNSQADKSGQNAVKGNKNNELPRPISTENGVIQAEITTLSCRGGRRAH